MGRHIQRCAGPAYSVPVAPVLRHETLSCFPIPLTTCTQRLSPGRGSLLLPQPCKAFSYTIQLQPPWCLPHICRAGCRTAIEHELTCNSGRQKVGSSGLHPCVHAAQLRTCTEQHTLFQVYSCCHLLFKKRGLGR